MKRYIVISIAALFALPLLCLDIHAEKVESNRKERNAITAGNKLYNDGRYRAAMLKYQEALKMNPNSAVARYNLGLSQIRLGSNPSDTTQTAKDMLKKGCESMEMVSKLGSQKPDLAAKANYNLGNVCFNSEGYPQALDYYKQALRLNPDDAAAKRNLRITQLKMQNQNQDKDKNQDQNKDQNQDQNKDQNKDQNQNKDQDQNKDQNQDQQQNKNQQQQPQDINQQTADQILKAMENKENQTRARVGNGSQGDKTKGQNRSRKNW